MLREKLLYLFIFLSFLASFCIITKPIIAACALCGPAGCSGQSIRCCTDTSYDPCSANGRTCENPCDNVECTNSNQCPDNASYEQCGNQGQCTVGKQCNGGQCQYYCTGYPPCGGGGSSDTTQPVCVDSEFTVNPTVFDTTTTTFTLSGRITDNVLLDRADILCLGCYNNCTADNWYAVRAGILLSGGNATFNESNITLPTECNARISSVGKSTFAVMAWDSSGNVTCCSPANNNCYKDITYTYTAGGRITKCGTSDGVSGATVGVYNDTWGAQNKTVVTDANGYWSIAQYLRNGDGYAVRPTPVGGHYIGSAKTTTSGWNWNYCVNQNPGTQPWGDTPLGSASYECQRRSIAVAIDCAGPNGSNEWQRCNFCFDVLPCATNMTATCTSPFRVDFNWTAIPGAANNTIRVDNTSNSWHGDENAASSPGCDDYGRPGYGCYGDRWINTTSPPATSVIVTPGVAYNWSVQGMLPGETYPYYGCQQNGPSFTCPTPTPVCGQPGAPVILNPGSGTCTKTEPSTYSIRQDYNESYCYPHDAWARILQGTNKLFTSNWNANRSAIPAPGGSYTYTIWEAGSGTPLTPTPVAISLGTGDYILRTLTAANQHDAAYSCTPAVGAGVRGADSWTAPPFAATPGAAGV